MKAFLDFVIHDWYFAIPMFAMSIVAITLVIWRILLNMNANTNLDEFLPLFQEKLMREGPDKALRMCQERHDVIPKRLFVAGLETSKQGLSAMRRSMANVIELEILPDLNFLLPLILAIAKIATMVGLFGTVISMIAKIATMVGLFGTVISMIGTFNKIQEAAGSGGNVTGHAGAIGLALFATALGLMTAIPLVFAHVLFKAWVGRFETRMKSSAQKLLVLMQAYKSQPAKPATAATGSAATASAAPPPPPAAAATQRR